MVKCNESNFLGYLFEYLKRICPIWFNHLVIDKNKYSNKYHTKNQCIKELICSFWDDKRQRPFIYLIAFLFSVILMHLQFSFSLCISSGPISLFYSTTCWHYYTVTHTLLSLISVGLVDIVIFFVVLLLIHVFLLQK